MASAGTPMKI